eukprot:Sdes_comp23878_c0_seq1m22008
MNTLQNSSFRKYALLLTFTFVALHFCGISLFIRGFLLTRNVINSKSNCSLSGIELPANFLQDAGLDQESFFCSHSPHYKKAVILVIDALRYDFTQWDDLLPEEQALPYQNKLPVFSRILSKQPLNSFLFKFIADPPTTT